MGDSARCRVLVWMAVCLFGCGGDEATPSDARGTGDAPPQCPEVGVPDGDACAPRLPIDACAPGTMAVIGEDTCVPVGWSDCPAGFAVPEGRWGCRDIMPDMCAGATRPSLGDRECVPVGDCRAAFPPGDATLLVNAAYSDLEIDATHVRTIGEALAAALAGDVIAIESGSYPEGLAIDTSVTIVGRCPAEVVIAEPGGDAPGASVQAASVDAVLRGVTITGHRGGVVITAGTLTLEDVVVEGAREIGAVSVFDGDLHLIRSVIRATQPAANGPLGRGVDAEDGGRVTVTESAIEDNLEVGVFLQGAGTRFEGSNIVVRGTKEGPTSGGRGIEVKDGAQLEAKRIVVADNGEVGLFAIDPGTTITLTDAVIRDTRMVDGVLGEGIDLQDGATLTATRITVADNHQDAISVEGATATLSEAAIESTAPLGLGDYGTGVYAAAGALVELSRSAVADNTDIALVSIGAASIVRATDVLVSRAGDVPLGVYGVGVAALEGGRVEAERLTVSRALTAGVFVGIEASAVLTRLFVSESQPAADGSFGHGLVAIEGGRLELSSSLIDASAAVGMLFSASGARVTGSFVRANPVALHAQDGSRFVEGSGAGAEPLDVVIADDCILVDNETRIGAGALPLPDPSGIEM